MSAFVDLHAHYLPALDDGAPDLATALTMIRAAQELGFTYLCATPHQRADLYMPSREAIDAALAHVRQAVSSNASTLRIDVAAENYWDSVLHERLATQSQPSYPGKRAFLFEIPPPQMPPAIETVLFRLRLAGLLPVMAHPERYRAFQEDLSRAEAIGRVAALVVDLGALSGAHGRPQKKLARQLLEENLAHAAATDMHAPTDVPAIAEGIAWIRKRLGPTRLDLLLNENPHKILIGEIPT